MSRLAILYSVLFALLLLLPSTSDTARFADPEDPFDGRWVLVQLEEPREVVHEEEIPAWQGDESEWIHSGDPNSIPRLVHYLRSFDESVQRAALAEFAGMGSKAKPAAPAVLAALNDPESSIRVEAAATLVHMNVHSQAALRALRKELKAEDATAREQAARTIGELVKPPVFLGSGCWGPDPPPPMARPWVGRQALPALAEALRDQVPGVRAEAAHSLGLLGLDAKPAASALTKALRDEEKAVRDAAKQALQRINRKAAVKPVRK